jgi:RNA polymerase sigma-70 factor (ECF subfamily)
LLRLRFHDGLPVRDIAARWDADPAKLHHEYARAREEFRAALREVVAFHQPGSADAIDRACADLLGLLG